MDAFEETEPKDAPPSENATPPDAPPDGSAPDEAPTAAPDGGAGRARAVEDAAVAVGETPAVAVDDVIERTRTMGPGAPSGHAATSHGGERHGPPRDHPTTGRPRPGAEDRPTGGPPPATAPPPVVAPADLVDAPEAQPSAAEPPVPEPPVDEIDHVIDDTRGALRQTLVDWEPPDGVDPAEAAHLRSEVQSLIDSFEPKPGQSPGEASEELLALVQGRLAAFAEEHRPEGDEPPASGDDDLSEVRTRLHETLSEWEPPHGIDPAEAEAFRSEVQSMIDSFEPPAGMSPSEATEELLELVQAGLAGFAEEHRAPEPGPDDWDVLAETRAELHETLDAWEPPEDLDPEAAAALRSELESMIDSFEPEPGQSPGDAAQELLAAVQTRLVGFAESQTSEDLDEPSPLDPELIAFIDEFEPGWLHDTGGLEEFRTECLQRLETMAAETDLTGDAAVAMLRQCALDSMSAWRNEQYHEQAEQSIAAVQSEIDALDPDNPFASEQIEALELRIESIRAELESQTSVPLEFPATMPDLAPQPEESTSEPAPDFPEFLGVSVAPGALVDVFDEGSPAVVRELGDIAPPEVSETADVPLEDIVGAEAAIAVMAEATAAAAAAPDIPAPALDDLADPGSLPPLPADLNPALAENVLVGLAAGGITDYDPDVIADLSPGLELDEPEADILDDPLGVGRL